MSAHDEAYIAKFQPAPEPARNTYIIHVDYTAEWMHFHTDASIRRYCRLKGALLAFRQVECPGTYEHGMYTPVYQRDGGEE